MKKIVAFVLAVVLCLLPVCCFAEDALEAEIPIALNENLSVLLLDAVTGQVIYQQNETVKRPVASVTKLMTMLLVMEAIDNGVLSLKQEITVSERAQSMGGSQVYLEAGGVYSLSELLKSLIVASANDSAVALAEAVSGSETAFVEKMNKRAQELGLHDTLYVNCTGLPKEGQYTTAKDVVALSLEVISHPLYFKYSKIWTDSITHRGGRVTDLCNTNRLIRFYDGADGIKTGFTNEAGFCISATAKRGEQRFIAVVLGGSTSKGRFSAAEELLSYAFANYESKTLIKAGGTVAEIPVEKGTEETVALEVQEDVSVLIRKGQEASFEVSVPESMTAPVEKGQKIGCVKISVDGAETEVYPLFTKAAVAQTRLTDEIYRIFMSWMWF